MSAVAARKLSGKWAAAHHSSNMNYDVVAAEDDASEGVPERHGHEKHGNGATAHERERERAPGEQAGWCRLNANFS